MSMSILPAPKHPLSRRYGRTPEARALCGGVTSRTLRKWVLAKRIPAPRKIANTLLWDLVALEAAVHGS